MRHRTASMFYSVHAVDRASTLDFQLQQCSRWCQQQTDACLGLWQAPSSWRNLTCLANESPTVDDECDRVAHDPKVRHEGYDGNPSDRHEHDAIAGRPVGGPAVDAEVTAIEDNHGYDVED